jgi:HptB-dependent secretion and biofilm anti anti-sigma factor
VSVESIANGHQTTINIIGRFDFKTLPKFHEAYKSAPRDSEFIIDFARTEYIDSSAMGMLIMLREYTEELSSVSEKSTVIRLTNVSSNIKDILTHPQFQVLFDIE